MHDIVRMLVRAPNRQLDCILPKEVEMISDCYLVYRGNNECQSALSYVEKRYINALHYYYYLDPIWHLWTARSLWFLLFLITWKQLTLIALSVPSLAVAWYTLASLPVLIAPFTSDNIPLLSRRYRIMRVRGSSTCSTVALWDLSRRLKVKYLDWNPCF